MSKHADQKLTPARLILGLAAAVLVALVGWIVIRSGDSSAEAGGEPLLVQPSAADLQAVENHIPLDEALTTATASPGASTSVSPSPSPSVSVSVSVSASSAPASPSAGPTPSVSSAPAAAPTSPAGSSPIPEKTTTKAPQTPKPTRTTTAPPPPVDHFAATYSTTASWRGGFIASVRIENTSSESRDYTVTIGYPSGSDIKLYGVWNTRASESGNQVTLTGTLRGRSSVSAGFQGGKDGDSSVRSPSCSVAGGSCRVS
ncbi:hypothetical protein ACTI_29550 [Actinoplanes sp. OR16]|uniref:cellulose binding domain-containing protein n=1 Tax=Actinoplanes sp. OR16 TaxID=946334 RepID=UPI000F718F26|nr:cellulose binding domain-containing protein [Actinoplanes sp. OR16]BBH66270.1 hypothetical protein ACTI_29550 [Actinoplanes sp. OR16]